MQALKNFGVPQSFCIRVQKEAFAGYDFIGTASLNSCSAVFAEFDDDTIFFGHLMASQNLIGPTKNTSIPLDAYFSNAIIVKVWYNNTDENDKFTKDPNKKGKPFHPSLKYEKITKDNNIQGINGGTAIINFSGTLSVNNTTPFNNNADLRNQKVSILGLTDPGYCILATKVSDTIFQDTVTNLNK